MGVEGSEKAGESINRDRVRMWNQVTTPAAEV